MRNDPELSTAALVRVAPNKHTRGNRRFNETQYISYDNGCQIDKKKSL